MGGIPSLNFLEDLKTPKDRVRFVGLKEGEGDHERPLSTGARFFHEPGYNVYIIAQMGVKGPVDLDIFKANLIQLINKYDCFSLVAVNYIKLQIMISHHHHMHYKIEFKNSNIYHS